MRTTNRTTALGLALLLGLASATACGGDDDSSDAANVPSSDGLDDAVDDLGDLEDLDESILEPQCETSGTITLPDGSTREVQAHSGTVSTNNAGGGPPAFYQAFFEGGDVSIYAGSDTFVESVVLQADGTTYGTNQGDEVGARADGSGVDTDVDVVTSGTGEDTAHVVVRMSCP